jgi:glycerophosphoryl diester phosphodiesterase
MLNVSIEFLTKELVIDAHLKNLNIFVYTVNNYEDIGAVKKLGVDAVFSNFPDRL